MKHTAVITGGASGIGLGIAEALAGRGARILIADVEAETAERETGRLRASGADAASFVFDALSAESHAALAEAAFSRFGAVSLFFNNAGVGAPGPLHKLSDANFDWVFGVNVKAIYHAARAFVPRLLAQETPARFVITASEHALGLPVRGGGATPYTASKHAALGLALSMRRDYADSNLAVSVICPGLVQSQIWNTFRNRPAQFGGPRQAPEALSVQNQSGITAALAGERIVRQIEAGAFYVFTHGDQEREVAEAYRDEIFAALDGFDAARTRGELP